MHDYQCPTCGEILRDIYRPASMGAQAFPPIHCESPMEWLPQIGRISCFAESDKTRIPVEDPSTPSGYRWTEIDSLATIRRLERESEQSEKNGDGGRRMVWRDFSNDRSNADVHSLCPDPSRPIPKTFANGTPVKGRRGAAVVADHGSLEDEGSG